MTKYRLIDTELQKNLDKISNNEFSNWLGRISPCVFPVTFKLNGRKEISFYADEIEPVREWKYFPDETPIDNLLMQIEILERVFDYRFNSHIWEPVNRFCGYFEGNKIYEYTDFPFEVKEGLKVRYRTWE